MTKEEKKWQDWLLLACQVLSPIIGVLFAVFVKGTSYTIDHRLATIVAGITISISIQGINIKAIKDTAKKSSTGLNSLSADIVNYSNQLIELKNEMKYNEDLARILQRGEERRIQYARRRLDEFKTILYIIADGIETPLLSVSTYYYELNALKAEIDKDPDQANCKIWAMTGFSNKEWDVDENTLEREWCESLMELVKKVTTDRICIIDLELEKQLNREKEYYIEQQRQWDVNQDQPELNIQKNLKSFFDYLHAYYGPDSQSLKVNSYYLKKVPPSQSNPTKSRLIEAKGYFGIKLSDEKKYVIKGEAVDPQTGLQGQYVFSDTAVNDLYASHLEGCNSFERLEDFLMNSRLVSNGFREFLQTNGINLDSN